MASTRCAPCFEDPASLLSIDNILEWQKLSDFLIAIAYFSIPLELFYFVTCAAIFPFRWILLQFGAFIVLCGLTHLAATFTYAPHSFLLVLTLTVLKFLTALVSIATAVTLLTLIPQLLRVFVREGLLREKTRELGREVGIMKRQEEAGWHVRMLTREIRRSLDRHTILYTTLVELSKALLLEHCSIWMPGAVPSKLVLTHEMSRRRRWSADRAVEIPVDDRDVSLVVRRKEAVILGRDSSLIRSREEEELGEVVGSAAAIRMRLLGASDFNSGTLELCDARYAILVLVLPGGDDRGWTEEELEIVEVVADQVAVALSHASVLEESMAVREQLMERNAMLEQERRKVEQAAEARRLFQKVMTKEIDAPVRSVVACFSELQLENLAPEQLTLVKGASVLASLVGDTAESSRSEDARLELKLRPFDLHRMVEEAANVAKLLCTLHDSPFECRVSKGIPKLVVGDDRRIFQCLLYMIENVLASGGEGGVVLHLTVEGMSQGWKPNVFADYVKLRFKVGRADFVEEPCSLMPVDAASGQAFSHATFAKLAELMHGSLAVLFPTQALQRIMSFQVRLQQEKNSNEFSKPKYLDQETALILLRGMRILLVDRDSFNRTLTRKILERTGCELTCVSSWYQCLEAFCLKGNKFHILLIDLRILEEGDDVAGRIRKLQSESWLLFIALLPNMDRDVKERCIASGIHGVIRKPVVLQEMFDEIQRITQQLQATPALS